MIDSMAPEFSRPVRVESLNAGDNAFEIAATAEECAALAERFDMPAIERFSAHISLRRVRGSRLVRMRASFEADIVQTCVVTLEPIPAHIQDKVIVLFGPEDEIATSAEITVGEDDEPPEPIVNGVIDMGAILSEYLSLAIDPFPRKAGAEIDEDYSPPPIEEPVQPAKPNPFSVLAQYRDKLADKT